MTAGRPNLEEAIALATACHAGQFDKAGLPYINHPLWVMRRMRTVPEKMVAILHDAVEDTGLTLQQLRDFGYSEMVVEAVDAITKRPAEDHDAYYARVARNRIALAVKRKDIEHNLSDERLRLLAPAEQVRLRAKYAHANAVLDALSGGGREVA